MTTTRGLPLRSVMAVAVAVVAVLALVSSGALVSLSTLLHRTTQAAGASVESVRLAEEIEIDLLLHGRAQDPLVRRNLETSLVRRLSRVQAFVTAPEEQRILEASRERVETYLRATPADAPRLLEEAYAALESLVNVNVSQARAAQEQAALWEGRARAAGLGVSVLILVATVAVLMWLRRRAFAPVLSLADAMERYARGERSARAEERGPTDLVAMSRRFNEMAAQLAAQRAAQIAFLGGVAHDLRGPLAAQKMTIALLRAPAQALTPRCRELVDRVERQIDRLERMVGDFLDTAKIEAGELAMRRERHDARVIVADVASLFADADHPLEVRVPPTALPLDCDRYRLEQVLANLVSNALKYSPAHTLVRVVAEARGDDVVVSVTDAGMGIAAEDHARVFEPFRRAGLSREAVPGVGLGLYIVKRIVEAHGGRVELESAVGAGSTFRVLLPCAKAPATERLLAPAH